MRACSKQRLQLGPVQPTLADLLAGGLPVLEVLNQGVALAVKLGQQGIAGREGRRT
jgi:hypothetical protein